MSEELIKRLEALEALVKQIREELSKPEAVELPFWMPSTGKRCHYIDDDGNAVSYVHHDDSTTGHILIGNYAETEEILKKRIDKLKLLEEIKQWRGKHDPDSFKLDWKNPDLAKWQLIFGYGDMKWEFIDAYAVYTPEAIYLSEDAPTDKFLEHFGDRLDLLLEGDGE